MSLSQETGVVGFGVGWESVQVQQSVFCLMSVSTGVVMVVVRLCAGSVWGTCFVLFSEAESSGIMQVLFITDRSTWLWGMC